MLTNQVSLAGTNALAPRLGTEDAGTVKDCTEKQWARRPQRDQKPVMLRGASGQRTSSAI